MFTQEELDAIRAADLEMEREERAKRPKLTEEQRLKRNAYQREYQRKYRAEHREKCRTYMRLYMRVYAKKNRNKMNAIMRKYYLKRAANALGNNNLFKRKEA